MHSTMQELDSVYVPQDAVTFSDIATICKIQALARGRIIRRQRQDQEAAVVTLQVSPRTVSSAAPRRHWPDSAPLAGCVSWAAGAQAQQGGRVVVELRPTSDRQPQSALPIQRSESATEKHSHVDV